MGELSIPNGSESQIEQELKRVVREHEENPLRGSYMTSQRIYKKMDIDYRRNFCTEVMKRCDFLEYDNGDLAGGTRFKINPDHLY